MAEEIEKALAALERKARQSRKDEWNDGANRLPSRLAINGLGHP